VVRALERSVGKAHVSQVPPAMGSEDFSFFANEVPGFFYRLGQVKPGTTSGSHHPPTFLADYGAIPVGVKTMSIVILDYLSRGSTTGSSQMNERWTIRTPQPPRRLHHATSFPYAH